MEKNKKNTEIPSTVVSELFTLSAGYMLCLSKCECVCVCARLCLLSLLVRVPGVLSQTEQETILVSDRGRELVIARERERRRELAEGSE